MAGSSKSKTDDKKADEAEAKADEKVEEKPVEETVATQEIDPHQPVAPGDTPTTLGEQLQSTPGPGVTESQPSTGDPIIPGGVTYSDSAEVHAAVVPVGDRLVQVKQIKSR